MELDQNKQKHPHWLTRNEKEGNTLDLSNCKLKYRLYDTNS